MTNSAPSIFPVINTIDDLKPKVAHKEEIRFMTQDNGTVVGCYLVSMEATFDDAYARECRGIVFSKTGEVIARPLSKFFNVNEKVTTQVAALPWDQVVRVMDKRDGSMIHTVRVDDLSPFDCSTKTPGMVHTACFDIKSKKSYSSDVANNARMFLAARLNYRNFCEAVTKNGQTAIFEWTSPTARIVLAYKQDELKLLHIRDNDTGNYLTRSELESIAAPFDIPLCDDVNLDGENFIQTTKSGQPLRYILTKDRPLIDQFLELVETMEDNEGWIFQFKNGDMVKLKTKDYMRKHRAMTFLQERHIAEYVLDEKIDDMKAMLVGEGVDITEILSIENDVVSTIELIIDSTESKFAQVQAEQLSKKDVALRMGPAAGKETFEYFGLLMKKMDGKEPDYTDFFRKRVFPERYTARQLNMTQSVAEVE